jgi:hypothetical protein
MSLLKNLKQDDVQEEKDVLGGSSFIVETGAQEYTIELAYVTEADSGATALNLHLKNGNTLLRQTMYITSGKAKGQKTYYEKDGKKHNLPGFALANSLCLLTVGKEISELDTEQKVAKLYDREQKKEVPTSVNAITDLHGQRVIAAIVKQVVDKTAKNDKTGEYEPTGETREENEIEKFFRIEDGLTVSEIKQGVKEATFLNAWKDKWTGVTKNKAKGSGTASGTSGQPGKAAGNASPTKSLFAK